MARRRIRPHTLRRAKQLRREMTGPEKRLWSFLRDHRLRGLKFRRQQPIGPYVVDFFCSSAKLILEIDGESHADRGEYDRARQSFLEKAGYRVLRISNDDVLDVDVEPVLWAILKAAGQTVEGMSPTPLGEADRQARSAGDDSTELAE
jgi:very-short-patch-repair endonuclease